jgi:hypothetical protein
MQTLCFEARIKYSCHCSLKTETSKVIYDTESAKGRRTITALVKFSFY